MRPYIGNYCADVLKILDFITSADEARAMPTPDPSRISYPRSFSKTILMNIRLREQRPTFYSLPHYHSYNIFNLHKVKDMYALLHKTLQDVYRLLMQLSCRM